MQQNQQFIDSLIGLKKHYELICSSSSTLITDSKERLTNHVNMLLFDPTVEDIALTETIVSMRHQWQNSIRDYEHQIYHAKEQINHVNALLVDLIEMPHQEREVEIQTSTLEKEEVSSLLEAVENVSDDSHTQIKGTELQEMPLSDSVSAFVKSDESSDEVPYLAPVLLPQYQTFTQIEAVESLLKAYPGAVLHIDYIMRTLYGNRSPSLEVMSEILNFGVTQALWYEIPDEPDCYTWDLKLVEPDEPTLSENEQILEPDKPNDLTNDEEHSTELMLPDYQHLSLTEAVRLVLSESYPSSLNIDDVTHSLFGSTAPSARSRVRSSLKKGVERKYWERVAGQNGIYIFQDKSTDISSTPSVNTPSTKPELLPQYQDMSFVEVVEKVLKESYPRPLNIVNVTKKIFGSVEKESRKKVTGWLVGAANSNRIRRVAGQTGVYVYRDSSKGKK